MTGPRPKISAQPSLLEEFEILKANVARLQRQSTIIDGNTQEVTFANPNTVVNLNILFSKQFDFIPIVQLTPVTSDPRTLQVSYNNPTTDGFIANIFSTITGTRVFSWIAYDPT